MKRSEVNRILESAVAFLHETHFHLPPFAYWSLEEWSTKGPEYAEIKDNMLGWDITDFGSGDFRHTGLLIFTLRNGNLYDERYVKPYCEKILIQDDGQVLPFHFHWKKMEDIINRGGGNLMVQLYNSRPDGEYADTPVEITMDGHRFQVEAGGIVRVRPGESITLMPGQYHCFWAEKGSGKTLLGEVSMVNDDRVDNRFHDRAGRLPDIEEDEKPRYLLFKDYEALERLCRLYL